MANSFLYCQCLICVYALSIFVPVSLNVAGDDDDDIHMTCFSSRSLKIILTFFLLSVVFNFSVMCRKAITNKTH